MSPAVIDTTPEFAPGRFGCACCCQCHQTSKSIPQPAYLVNSILAPVLGMDNSKCYLWLQLKLDIDAWLIR